MAIIIPLVFLWTGVLPMVNVTLESVLYYVVPTILATVGGICIYAPKQYFPLAAQVLGTFQSFKIFPSVLLTVIKPFGHTFKVTPKGVAARTESYDQEVFWTAASLLVLTVAGIIVNLLPEWRIIAQTALIPVVAAGRPTISCCSFSSACCHCRAACNEARSVSAAKNPSG